MTAYYIDFSYLNKSSYCRRSVIGIFNVFATQVVNGVNLSRITTALKARVDSNISFGRTLTRIMSYSGVRSGVRFALVVACVLIVTSLVFQDFKQPPTAKEGNIFLSFEFVIFMWLKLLYV